MTSKRVLMTAEHHNWGLCTRDDWQQTKYVIFEDGTLLSIVFEGRNILASARPMEEKDLRYITDNIKSFVYDAPDVKGCDGDAWQFEGPDFEFQLGYISGSELEKIAELLLGSDGME